MPDQTDLDRETFMTLMTVGFSVLLLQTKQRLICVLLLRFLLCSVSFLFGINAQINIELKAKETD